MRWAAILLLSASAVAQIHGTPASVGSTPAGGTIGGGVPASVTSVGPRGFADTSGPRVFPEPTPAPRGHHGGPRGNVVPYYVPVYYGYPYVEYSNYDTRPPQQVVERVVEREAPPQRVEIVIVDKREQERKAEAEAAELKKAAEPKQSNLSEPSDIAAIFVFKDGTRKELHNFAIIAGTLYDLSDGKMFKIAMTTIDREKTLAANAEAGRGITLP